MSRSSAWGRGALVVTLGVVSFLLADDHFRARVGPDVLTGLGALNVLLAGWRLFIDRSLSQADTEAAPVRVTNAPGETLDVTPKQEVKS